MFIGYLKINIFIPHSRSLKMKRQIIERIKNKVRNNFNVSIAERPSDKWQICELSFVCVNYTKRCIHKTMQCVEEFVRFNNEVNILNVEKEII